MTSPPYQNPGPTPWILGLLLLLSMGGTPASTLTSDAVQETRCDTAGLVASVPLNCNKWVQRIPGPMPLGEDNPSDMVVGPDGETLYVTGSLTVLSPQRLLGDPEEAEDLWTKEVLVVAALDATTGLPRWTQTVEAEGTSDAHGYTVSVAPEGEHLYVAGFTDGALRRATALALALDAETGEERWRTTYDGPAGRWDAFTEVQLGPDGEEVYVGGVRHNGSPFHGGTKRDQLVMSLRTEDGGVTWKTIYDGPASGSDFVSDLAISSDGSRLVVTGSATPHDTWSDVATLALDAETGEILWLDLYNGPNGLLDGGRAVEVTEAGVVLVGGSETGLESQDMLALGYDLMTGDRLWVTSIDGPGGDRDTGHDLVVSPDGTTAFLTGGLNSGSTQDVGTVAVDASSGEVRWTSTYAGLLEGGDIGATIAVQPSGDRVFVYGTSAGLVADPPAPILPHRDAMVFAYDAETGEIDWVSRYTGHALAREGAGTVAVSPDGGSVYAAFESEGPGTGFDITVAGYSAACISFCVLGDAP